MRIVMLTGASLMLSAGIAFAGQCSGAGLQTAAAGMNHMRLAQNNAGNTGSPPTGATTNKPTGVGVPAAVGSSSATGGAESSGNETGSSSSINSATSTGKPSGANVPAAVGHSGATGGAKTSQ